MVVFAACSPFFTSKSREARLSMGGALSCGRRLLHVPDVITRPSSLPCASVRRLEVGQQFRMLEGAARKAAASSFDFSPPLRLEGAQPGDRPRISSMWRPILPSSDPAAVHPVHPPGRRPRCPACKVEPPSPRPWGSRTAAASGARAFTVAGQSWQQPCGGRTRDRRETVVDATYELRPREAGRRLPMNIFFPIAPIRIPP